MCTYQYYVNCVGNIAQKDENDCKAEILKLQALVSIWATNVFCVVN
jgi:hypothetical protein